MAENLINRRPTYAQIDLDSLAFNFRSVQAFLTAEPLYMAVVKANAYGHGAIECSLRLEGLGVNWFGVASPFEGFALRAGGIRRPILCFGGPWAGEEEPMLNHSITPVVFDLEYAERIAICSKKKGVRTKVHIEIDTGMGRVGVPYHNAGEFADRLLGFPEIEVEGMMTHFASADDIRENEFTNSQIERFYQSVSVFRARGFEPTIIDMANSAGAIAHPASRGNLVRLGGILYGLSEDVLPTGVERPDLRPVMSLVSELAFIKHVPKGTALGYGRTFVTERDSVIGTIPIGYHDGFHRGFSNRAQVIVNGDFSPVVGRVSMDWTIIDLTDVTNPKCGDRVTLIGTQSGRSISAEELAAMLDTISYEVTCGISDRVPRYFSGCNDDGIIPDQSDDAETR